MEAAFIASFCPPQLANFVPEKTSLKAEYVADIVRLISRLGDYAQVLEIMLIINECSDGLIVRNLLALVEPCFSDHQYSHITYICVHLVYNNNNN